MVNQKIYVRMENDEVCMKFYEWAEHEGYTFGGEKPTSKHPSDLIAVLPGKTLCYVNTYGRIAAHSGAENFLLKNNPQRNLVVFPADGGDHFLKHGIVKDTNSPFILNTSGATSVQN